jgi:hypothetical protein
MSTRSNIAIRLREADRNKTFETPWGEKVKPNGAPFLNIYCHNDGYPEGVGADLKDMFDGGSYEEALEYILRGDRSTTGTSYYDWRGEKCAPDPEQSESDCYQQDYLYVIMEENGKLVVKQWNEYGYEGEEEYDEAELGEMAEEFFENDVECQCTKQELQDIGDDPVDTAEACADFYDLNFDNDLVRGVLCNTIGSLAYAAAEDMEDGE